MSRNRTRSLGACPRSIWIGIVTAVPLTAQGEAQAQAVLEVAIVATGSGCQFTDPQDKLTSTGLFDRVDVIDVASSTPTLAELLQYDAVICWTNILAPPQDWEAWGDVTADYVDAGGGVVVAVAANSAVGLLGPVRLGGRWDKNPDYEVIVTESGEASGTASLGVVHEPEHPLMKGIDSFSGEGANNLRPRGTDLHPGAKVIVEWSDGKILAAVGHNPQRVDLGFWPPSDDPCFGGWSSSTDGARLMGNALLFVSGQGSEPCFADCDESGELDFFDFLCFQNEFAAGTEYADCDESGEHDFFDFLCFQNEFAAGCP